MWADQVSSGFDNTFFTTETRGHRETPRSVTVTKVSRKSLAFGLLGATPTRAVGGSSSRYRVTMWRCARFGRSATFLRTTGWCMHNGNPPSVLRRSSRVPAIIPFLVTRLDEARFSQVCENLVVNAHGCAI